MIKKGFVLYQINELTDTKTNHYITFDKDMALNWIGTSSSKFRRDYDEIELLEEE